MNLLRYRQLSFLGFPQYKVGTDGSIWTKHNNRWGSGKWKMRRLVVKDCGHLQIGLYYNGCEKVFLVHHLVLLAFVGPCPKGMECCHEDDNPTNNNLSNLRWDTRKANKQDAVRNGRTNKGIKHPLAKLTDDRVVAIRNRYAIGDCTQKEIANDEGVDQSLISMICSRKIWGHL